jgi:RNA 2',3'-cyclic 3'-phosphodiesterase
MRLFFGIDFPASVKSALAAVQHQLQTQGIQAGNWSDASLFHCTVLFLGELDAGNLPILKEVGRQAAGQVSPFQLTINESVGVFEKGRILWMDIHGDEGLQSLSALHQATRQAIEPHRLVHLESRPYRAHITLARKVDASSIEAIRAGYGSVKISGFPQSVPVEHLCLFESTRINGKLVYPVIERFPLGGQ